MQKNFLCCSIHRFKLGTESQHLFRDVIQLEAIEVQRTQRLIHSSKADSVRSNLGDRQRMYSVAKCNVVMKV
ncbi:hypothetical protein Tco_1468311 [Tanacetum coccineum]